MHPIHVLCVPHVRNFLFQPCVAVLHMRKFVGTGRFAKSHVVRSDSGTHISRAPRPATPHTHPSVPLVMACRVPAVRIEPNTLPALPELVICVGGRHRLPILGVGGTESSGLCGCSGGGCGGGRSSVASLTSRGSLPLWSRLDLPCRGECRFLYFLTAIDADKSPRAHASPWILGCSARQFKEGEWGAHLST